MLGEMLELRYLTGIRCGIVKLALAGPHAQPLAQAPRCRPWTVLPHFSRECLYLCVQSPVGDWAASVWGWGEEWDKEFEGP